MLGPDPGRVYLPIQRALEVAYNLEPYSLEPVIEEWKSTCMEHALSQARQDTTLVP